MDSFSFSLFYYGSGYMRVENCWYLQATFAKYDKDGDGGLTEEEWYEVMKDSGSDISR